MCGRYHLEMEQDVPELRRIMDGLQRRHQESEALAAMKTGEIFPKDVVAAVTREGPTLMRWGFTPHKGKGLVINARRETVLERPMFFRPVKDSRCLLPATWYYEWFKRGPKGANKYAIAPEGAGLFYLAGIYRQEQPSALPVCTILTRPPTPDIVFIHDRMPMIFTAEGGGAWLGAEADVEALLRTPPPKMAYRLA